MEQKNEDFYHLLATGAQGFLLCQEDSEKINAHITAKRPAVLQNLMSEKIDGPLCSWFPLHILLPITSLTQAGWLKGGTVTVPEGSCSCNNWVYCVPPFTGKIHLSLGITEQNSREILFSSDLTTFHHKDLFSACL